MLSPTRPHIDAVVPLDLCKMCWRVGDSHCSIHQGHHVKVYYLWNQTSDVLVPPLCARDLPSQKDAKMNFYATTTMPWTCSHCKKVRAGRVHVCPDCAINRPTYTICRCSRIRVQDNPPLPISASVSASILCEDCKSRCIVLYKVCHETTLKLTPTLPHLDALVPLHFCKTCWKVGMSYCTSHPGYDMRVYYLWNQIPEVSTLKESKNLDDNPDDDLWLSACVDNGLSLPESMRAKTREKWAEGLFSGKDIALPSETKTDLFDEPLSEQELLEIALLESRSEAKSSSSSDAKRNLFTDHNIEEDYFTDFTNIPETCTYAEKKRNYSDMMQKEVVVSDHKPWLCTCGFLNPRTKPPLFPGWGCCRHICAQINDHSVVANENQLHERSSGLWECPICTFLHPLDPYDKNFNIPFNTSNKLYPKKRCSVCEHVPLHAETVRILYTNGLDIDKTDEEMIIKQMEFYRKSKTMVTSAPAPIGDCAEEQEQLLKRLMDHREMDDAQDFDPSLHRLVLSPRRIHKILLRCYPKEKTATIAKFALWLFLHGKLRLAETDDRGTPMSLWTKLAPWLAKNPVTQEVWCFAVIQGQDFLPLDLWITVADYSSVFNPSDDMNRVHFQWLHALIKIV
jgi:hypothetical protein